MRNELDINGVTYRCYYFAAKDAMFTFIDGELVEIPCMEDAKEVIEKVVYNNKIRQTIEDIINEE